MHAYAARDPLLDLHEISRGIVLWYQGKGRSGGIGNGFDHPFVDHTRHSICRERDFCPFLDI